MIKSLHVHDLFLRTDHTLMLHPDLNILTGRNGSGKTTLLKLMWYMISPNVERIIPEILFREATVETDLFSLTIARGSRNPRGTAWFSYREEDSPPLEVKQDADDYASPDARFGLERINQRINALPTSSVFFPTFRRIEGGYSIDRRRSPAYSDRYARNLSDAVSFYAERMSAGDHRFVSYISTVDVVDLLTRQYAEVSEKTNNLHLAFSSFITERVGTTAPSPGADSPQIDRVAETKAVDLLNDIRSELAQVDRQRDDLMKPFAVLGELIARIFKDKGIIVSENLTFGEATSAIRADILSAGEKQMLSFLCYNAFTRGSPFFIDEPELSLHGDWQRLLFPTLLSQQTSNQFVVSTHSPFIYSKYPEKEILLDTDRGE